MLKSLVEQVMQGKFILAFNDNKEASADITPVQLSDAHNQYQFLSDEASKK